MSKVAHYLQEHLVGEVLTSSDARKYFSTDGSIFTLTPTLIAYPRNENDVRKTARFSWQLAERGRLVPITPRGLGNDESGAAIGEGMMLVFPAHMNRVLEFDSKTGIVTIEPGINFGKLQQTLHTHSRFLPAFPSSLEYTTVGGAIANNTAGEKATKYGCMRDYVKGLRVVLANGEVIVTSRLNKRELNKKLGLATLEGEIYRSLDKLLEENEQLLGNSPLGSVSKNATGYDLWNVRRKDGSFDLTPLLVGSQGTLGIITEATLSSEPYNPNTTLIAVFFDDTRVAEQLMGELRNLSDAPSAVEMIDAVLLQFIEEHNPNLLKGVVSKPMPKLITLIEFDDSNERLQKRLVKKLTKLLNQYNVTYQVESDEQRKEQLWKICHSITAFLAHTEGNAKAVPFVEDGVVPIDRLHDFMSALYELFAKSHVRTPIWGHAGNANLYTRPLLDLSQVGDRQKVFRLMEDYYKLVMSFGGSTSGEYNDGRLRAPYLPQLYGNEIYELFRRVKHIFDPYHILNPGVKIDVTLDSIKPLLRHEYTMQQWYDHLPRS